MSDEDRLVMLESELAETRRKLAESEQHLASANQIIGSYSTVRCGLVKGHADPRYAALAAHLKTEIAEKETARAQLAVARTPTDGVWMWQGCGDEPEGLSCPVVMSADTLRGLLSARTKTVEEIVAYLRDDKDVTFRFGETLAAWLANRVDGWMKRPSASPPAHRADALDRCQASESGAQCSLPSEHLSDHVFGVPPLTTLQAFAWAEERARARKAERGCALRELQRRADWLADECRKGGTCYVERDEAYIAVKTLERFYEHGTPK